MTSPIRGPNGLPPDAVPPIQPIPRIASPQNEQGPPEQPDAENTDPAVRAEQELRQQQFLDALRKTRAEQAEGEGGIDVVA